MSQALLELAATPERSGAELRGLSTAEAHRLAKEAIAAVPQIDILVNNAGMSIRGNFWDVRTTSGNTRSTSTSARPTSSPSTSRIAASRQVPTIG